MGKNKFALERGGEKSLVVEHPMSWKQVSVSLGGEKIGEINDPEELKRGKEFELPDGRILAIDRSTTFPAPELHLSIDGRAVPGADNDPTYRCNCVFWIFLIFGMISFAIVGVAMGLQIKPLLKIMGGMPGVVAMFAQSVVYVIFALLAKARLKWAILLGAILFCLDIVAGTVMPLLQKPTMPPPIPILIIKAFCVFYMFKTLKYLPVVEEQSSAEIFNQPL